MDENDAKELISNINIMSKCLSQSKKEAHPLEKVTINFAFASVVSNIDIKKIRLLQKMIFGLKGLVQER